jgi:hypothetical protein
MAAIAEDYQLFAKQKMWLQKLLIIKQETDSLGVKVVSLEKTIEELECAMQTEDVKYVYSILA